MHFAKISAASPCYWNLWKKRLRPETYSGCVVYGSVESFRLPALWPNGCKAAWVWIDTRCLSATGRLSQCVQAAGQNIQCQKFIGNFGQGCPPGIYFWTIAHQYFYKRYALLYRKVFLVWLCRWQLLVNLGSDCRGSIIESQTWLWDIIVLV